MGPCLFRHGNVRRAGYGGPPDPLQWGRAFSGTEILHASRYSLYNLLLQWGRAFSGTEIPLHGAAYATPYNASMGPCLFRHGNYRKNAWMLPRCLGFNGAVPFQARKYTIGVYPHHGRRASMGPCLFRHGNYFHHNSYSINIIQLQWGRAFSGTEIPNYGYTYPQTRYPLQWGRAFSGTEITWNATIQDAERYSFNGAVPFQARKFQYLYQ